LTFHKRLERIDHPKTGISRKASPKCFASFPTKTFLINWKFDEADLIIADSSSFAVMKKKCFSNIIVDMLS
jgi:hypothetical protein